MIEEIKSFCEKSGILTKSNYSLKNSSYSRTGKNVRIALFPNCSSQLKDVTKFLQKNNFDFKLIGASTNLLFLDTVEYGCFIYTKLMNDINFHSDTVSVESGRLVFDLVRDLAHRGYGKIEGLEGIPGTVGGALTMNAGAYGYTISDTLISVEVIDDRGRSFSYNKEELDISNRSIKQLKDKIIVKAKFKTFRESFSKIETLIRRFHISRHQYQEWVYPNLGSVYIVPSLNINEDIRYVHTSTNKFLHFIYFLIFKLWFSKPLFFIRRSFPEFNLPFKLLKNLKIKSYNSRLASKTTVNTFANKNNSSLEILQYMRTLYEDSGRIYKLENEVCKNNISEVEDKKSHQIELEILKEIN
tara:strand:+ start:916 stop:1986 length:1071 start_codon:yes stop_codon:yes gene_type:complete